MVALFRSTDGTVTTNASRPVIQLDVRLTVLGYVSNVSLSRYLPGVVRSGSSGGFVRAEVPSGTGKRTAYALLDLVESEADSGVLDDAVVVIGFGRAGERRRAHGPLLQVLDSPPRRVIFDLSLAPVGAFYLAGSSRAGLRATPLALATGAVVPNDGISGVAVDVAMKANGWVLVGVNGFPDGGGAQLPGARTGAAASSLAAGVIDYTQRRRTRARSTATRAGVHVSRRLGALAAAAAAPAAQRPPPWLHRQSSRRAQRLRLSVRSRLRAISGNGVFEQATLAANSRAAGVTARQTSRTPGSDATAAALARRSAAPRTKRQ